MGLETGHSLGTAAPAARCVDSAGPNDYRASPRLYPPPRRAAPRFVGRPHGRGAGLFGAPDHDARTTRELLGPLPLAGLFCNGEIGPVGSTTFLHGFTASLGLLAPLEQATGS